MSLVLPGPLRHAARHIASPVPLGGICLASIGSTLGVFVGRTSVTSAAVGAAIGLAILLLVLGGRRLARTHAARRAGARFTETFEGILGGSEKDPEARSVADAELRRVLRGPERVRLLQDPWYLVLGVTGVGKTQVVRKSGLNVQWQRHQRHDGSVMPKDDAGTWSLDVWRADSAVFVDVAGRLTMPSGEDLRSEREWSDLAAALRDARPGRPLNGIVMMVSALSLIADSDEELEAKAESIRCRLESIRTTLQMRLPVYLVVSKTDRIEGFQALFEPLTAPEREQILGWSFAGDPDTAVSWPEVEGGIQDVMRALIRRRTTMLAAKRLADGEAPFLFPRQLRCVQERLKPYVTQVLRTCGAHGHMLRGVYFTSAEQVGEELSLEHAERTGARERDAAYRRRGEQAYFIRNLVEQKILIERNLGRATIDDGRLVLRRRTRAAAKAATILIPLVLLPAAVGGWGGLSEVGERQAALGDLSRDDPETRANARSVIAQHLEQPIRTPIFFAFAAAVDGSGGGVKQHQLVDALAVQVRREFEARLDALADRLEPIVKPRERFESQPRVHAAWRAVDGIRAGIEAGDADALGSACIELDRAMVELGDRAIQEPAALGSEMAVVIEREPDQTNRMLEVIRRSLAEPARTWPGSLAGGRDPNTRQLHADALHAELVEVLAPGGNLPAIVRLAGELHGVGGAAEGSESPEPLRLLGSVLGVARPVTDEFEPPMDFALVAGIRQVAEHASAVRESGRSVAQRLANSRSLAKQLAAIGPPGAPGDKDPATSPNANVRTWAASVRKDAVFHLTSSLTEAVESEPSVSRLERIDGLIASLEALGASDAETLKSARLAEDAWWTDQTADGQGPLARLRAQARIHGRDGRTLQDFDAGAAPETGTIRDAAAIAVQSEALEPLGETLDGLIAGPEADAEGPQPSDWLRLLDPKDATPSTGLGHAPSGTLSSIHDHVLQAWQQGIVEEHVTIRDAHLATVRTLAGTAAELEIAGRWLVAIDGWADRAGPAVETDLYPTSLAARDRALAQVAAGSGMDVRFRLEGPTTRPAEGITIASRRAPLMVNETTMDPAPGAGGFSAPVTLVEPLDITRSRQDPESTERFHVGDPSGLRLLDLIDAGTGHVNVEERVLRCSVQLELARDDGSSALVAAILIVRDLDPAVLGVLVSRAAGEGGGS